MKTKSLSFKTLSLTVAFLFLFNTITYAAPLDSSTLRQPATAVTKVSHRHLGPGARSALPIAGLAAIIALALTNLHFTADSAAKQESKPTTTDFLRNIVNLKGGPPTTQDFLREAIGEAESEPNAVKEGPLTTAEFLRKAIGEAESEPNAVQATTEEARIQALIRQLGGEDLSEHISAIEELKRMGGPKVFQALIDALEDAQARKAAVFILGELGDPKAISFLFDLLRKWSEDWLFCLEVAEALSKIDDPRVEQGFIDALRNGHYSSIRPNIISGLGRVGGPRSIGPLTRISTEDENPYIRYCTERALEQIRKRIAAAEKEPQPVVKEPSAEKAKPGLGDNLRTLRTIIKGFSEDVYAAVREELAQLIERERAARKEIPTPGPEIPEPVPAESNQPVGLAVEVEVPETALPVIPEPNEMIDVAREIEIPETPLPVIPEPVPVEPNEEVEVPVGPEGPEAVLPVMPEPNVPVEPNETVDVPTEPEVPGPALPVRLDRDAPKPVKPYVSPIVASHIRDLSSKIPSVYSRAVDALVKSGQEAVGQLGKALGDKENNPSVRRLSADALGRIGGPGAAETLIANGLGDADNQVRWSVTNALHKNRKFTAGPLNKIIRAKGTDPDVRMHAISTRRIMRFRAAGEHISYYYPIYLISVVFAGIASFIFVTSTKTGMHLRRRIMRKSRERREQKILLMNADRDNLPAARPVTTRPSAHTVSDETTKRIEHVMDVFLSDGQAGGKQNPARKAPAAEGAAGTDREVSLETRAAQMAIDIVAGTAAETAKEKVEESSAADEPTPIPIDAKLLEQLKDKDLSIRIGAACILAKAGDARAIPVLMEALRLSPKSATEVSIQKRAIEALGSMGDKAKEAVWELRRITTTSPIVFIKHAAAAAAERVEPGTIKDMAERKLLTDLHDKKLSVRVEAACALAKAGNVMAIPVLMQALWLSGNSLAMRHLRKKALGALDGMDAKTIGAVVDAADQLEILATDSPNRPIRKAVRAIIEKIQQVEQQTVTLEAPERVTALRPEHQILEAIAAAA